MIRRYCDMCDEEMTGANTPSFGANGNRLAAELKRRGKPLLKVEVLSGLDGTSNAGDVCSHCVLDALYRLDDRPKQALSDEAEQFLLRLANANGAIVSSGAAHAIEIADARSSGRWFQVGALGFILRFKDWRERAEAALHGATEQKP